jgi:VCBS repeat-containing protein
MRSGVLFAGVVAADIAVELAGSEHVPERAVDCVLWAEAPFTRPKIEASGSDLAHREVLAVNDKYPRRVVRILVLVACATVGVLASTTVAQANQPTAPPATVNLNTDGSDTIVPGFVHATGPQAGQPWPTKIAQVSGPVGTTTKNADGSYTYTPTAQERHAAAADSATTADKQAAFTITETSGPDVHFPETVDATVQPQNQPPTHVVTLLSVASKTDANGNTTHPNVLLVPDFTDPDGDHFTVTVTSNPSNGTVTSNGDGTFTYTPNTEAQDDVGFYDFNQAVAAWGYNFTTDAGWNPPLHPPTTDTLTLTANDGHGGSASHVVSIPISPYYDLIPGTFSGYPSVTENFVNHLALTITAPVTITPVGVTVTPIQELNINSLFTFSTDPSQYTSVPGSTPLADIGSCASDPTNANCATPPPPPSATSTQQIPTLPITDFFGQATAQQFISTAIAAATGGSIVAGSVIYAAVTAGEAVFLSW